MISLHLSQIFEARGIERPFSFLVQSGFSHSMAHNLLSENIRNIKFDHIEKLCLILHCTPHDILQWAPNRNTVVASNHPLFILKKEKKEYGWKTFLSTFSLTDLDQLADELRKKQNPNP